MSEHELTRKLEDITNTPHVGTNRENCGTCRTINKVIRDWLEGKAKEIVANYLNIRMTDDNSKDTSKILGLTQEVEIKRWCDHVIIWIDKKYYLVKQHGLGCNNPMEQEPYVGDYCKYCGAKRPKGDSHEEA